MVVDCLRKKVNINNSEPMRIYFCKFLFWQLVLVYWNCKYAYLLYLLTYYTAHGSFERRCIIIAQEYDCSQFGLGPTRSRPFCPLLELCQVIPRLPVPKLLRELHNSSSPRQSICRDLPSSRSGIEFRASPIIKCLGVRTDKSDGCENKGVNELPLHVLVYYYSI